MNIKIIFDFSNGIALILINSDEWLLAFSVTRNVQELLNVDENPNDIQTVHGIRFLNAIVLMFT